MKFLIIQTAFIGDVILATPLITELHRIYPDSEIDLLVKKGNEILLEGNPYVRHIISFDKSTSKRKSLKHLLKGIRAEKYDEVINLHRFGSSGILTAFSGAPSRVGFDKNPFSFRYTKKVRHQIEGGVHEVERNLQCIAHHGAQSLVRPSIYPKQEIFESIRKFQTGPYICMAPASVWFTKQLPREKWIELIQQQANDQQIYLLGGPDDQELCQRIVNEATHPNCRSLCGQLSILESAALMSGALMNYVNDSGPLHFCSAMNAPVTAFFCSTTPDFGFGPLSDNSRILEANPSPSCKPCGLHGHKACPKVHFKCGFEIKLD
ncbi:MAG: glycosyltransferase family 9 protein [Bacteroidetes bacterium]|nr:MAG: glycosyltransferase family 9 protein [Bacteroidota bacterium]